MKSLDYLEEKLNMGEIIYSKPIESVQAALSLFGDQRKTSPRNKNEQEKVDVETVLKDIASLKLELEAKDSAHKQALFGLRQSESTVEELLAQIMSSGFERDVYLNECRAHKARAEELKTKMKEMSDHTMQEPARIREQLSFALAELRAAQGEIFSLETQLVAARDAQVEASRRGEMVEKLKLKSEKLESELEIQERKNQDQSNYITLLETQIKQLIKQEGDSKALVQEEIALLKAEIHRQKSRTAEAEAAEARAISDNLSLNLVLKRLALESKKEERSDEEQEESDQLRELEGAKRELESAMQKVGEFRTRAEQAISRAEAAEKAKARLESRIMRWRELKEKRKQAIAALREDSISREKLNKFEYDSPVKSPTTVQPLGKVLKMEF